MGVTPNRDAVLTAYAQSLIKFKARQLSRRPGFTRSDQEDLEQDLTAHLLTQAHHFDPARGSANTFAERVIKSAIAMMLRGRRRQKRAAGLAAQSLERTFVQLDLGLQSLRDSLSAADHQRRTGNDGGDEDRGELVAAVTEAFRNLPPDLREICRRLSDGTASSVARDLGISRHQLRLAINRVRQHFEDADLGSP